ncbi:HPr family phosphocarrier protein [Thalassospira marina]|uniref:HPr family phosphocarrier protein n=1 Tax=Thalassospira marina TaxID=2048283 RepID=A0A2N3KSY3_9PROT|nr:HPr family phosphocarrier protein [Thalassospira marina]AUG51337.1 HPr family phosphocarrier protein [Thalassospira marina]PKR53606.1 HPr family phosphocarrier protein [Thalassospira marina]
MSQTEKRIVTIVNQRGLHARAAAKFVKLAGEFESRVMVRNRGTEVSGVSIMGLMMLAASTGTEIEIEATGSDCQQAIAALSELVEAKFHEE